MSRCLRQCPWQVRDKPVCVALMEFSPLQCTGKVRDKVRTNHESPRRDLCCGLSWFVSANLSRTLSQSRRNGIWAYQILVLGDRGTNCPLYLAANQSGDEPMTCWSWIWCLNYWATKPLTTVSASTVIVIIAAFYLFVCCACMCVCMCKGYSLCAFRLDSMVSQIYLNNFHAVWLDYTIIESFTNSWFY